MCCEKHAHLLDFEPQTRACLIRSRHCLQFNRPPSKLPCALICLGFYLISQAGQADFAMDATPCLNYDPDFAQHQAAQVDSILQCALAIIPSPLALAQIATSMYRYILAKPFGVLLAGDNLSTVLPQRVWSGAIFLQWQYVLHPVPAWTGGHDGMCPPCSHALHCNRFKHQQPPLPAHLASTARARTHARANSRNTDNHCLSCSLTITAA